MSEAIITPFLCTLDVVQNGVDFATFSDYIKSNYKKEVFILNGADFIDSGRQSKAESKGNKSSKYDVGTVISKGLKSKIDSDVSKLLEAKKKAIASAEKAATKAQAGSIKSSKSKKQIDTKPGLLFDGLIDVLYIITNFPYLPDQLQNLESMGLSMDAFFAIVPSNLDLSPSSPTKSHIEKSSRNQVKRSVIPGSEMDSNLNPNNYPPLRWNSLQTAASMKTAFVDIKAHEEPEEMFKELERAVINLLQARNDFNDKFSGRKIVDIPEANLDMVLTSYQEYLDEHQDDYVNAIYCQLQSHGFIPEAPPPAETQADIYDSIFTKTFTAISRKVVQFDKKDVPDPAFGEDLGGSAFPIMYQLGKWQLQEKFAKACFAVTNFISSPLNQYAYCGQKFDQMVASVNKKHQMGLPPSFFDWEQWHYSAELQVASNELQEALSVSSVVETLLDENTGLLFVLTLAPICKQNGHIFNRTFMPPTLSGVSEYLKYLKDSPVEQTKKRGPVIPAAVVKSGGDPSTLLPPVHARFEGDRPVYRLPLKTSSCAQYEASYVFDDNVRADISRDVLEGRIVFSASTFFKDLFAIYQDTHRIVISLIEGLKIILEDKFNMSILYIEQSIYYDGHDLVLKSSGESPMIIAESNAFIMQDELGRPLIMYPNGTISRYEKDRWRSVDCDGNTFVVVDGEKQSVEARHAKIRDIASGIDSHIRPDDIEYYTKDDGTRKIVFRDEVSIDQQADKTHYDILKFPIIQAEGNVKRMEINRFEITLEGKKASVSCADYTIELMEGKIHVKHGNTELWSSPKRLEIKAVDNVLVVDNDGTEKVCRVLEDSPKKKQEVYHTHFGDCVPVKETLQEPKLTELHRQFTPRFFVLRQDQTGTEYLRPDTLPEMHEYNTVVLHPSGTECKIVTRHPADPEEIPHIYIKHNPLPKVERANILKNLHIPKASKGGKKMSLEDEENEMSEASGLLHSMNYDAHVFAQALVGCLDRAHERFLEETAPEEPMEPEKLPLPPPTPSPRLLLMMANKYRNQTESFWDSPEAEFSMPVERQRREPKPVSPRIALRDPPRYFAYNDPPPPDRSEIPSPLRSSVFRAPLQPLKEPTRPMTLSAQPQAIVFGIIKAGLPAKASIVVTNTGSTPLHYSVTQPNHPLLTVTTPPGVVFPGLKMALEVELAPGSPQEVVAMFQLRTQSFNMDIPVTASIVDE